MVPLSFALYALFVLFSNARHALAAPAKRSSPATMFNNPNFVPPPKVNHPRTYNHNATLFVPPTKALSTRSTPASPYWVVYQDAWVSGENGPPSTSAVNGYNVFIMSFLLASGSADQATEWEELTSDQRSSIKSAYNAAGIKLMVSAFGSTEAPTSAGYDPKETANTMAAWVLQYDLDGIDVDYEDFDAMNAQNGSAESWLETFTQQLRVNLPQGSYIITHAPVAPWFSAGLYASGAYHAVNAAVGNLIDWYNVQFYNQGTSEYTTCSGLLTASSSTWPDTAVFQLAASGVPLDKIVIGKPATAADASNGYVDPNTLAGCVQQAKSQGWTGGVMVWQYPNAGASWIATVRSSSWPVSGGGGGGSPTTTTTTTTTTTSTTSSTSTSTSSSPTSTGGGGSGQCAGVAPWSSSVAYPGGSKVTYNGDLWTAKWWSEDDAPEGAAGDWTKDGSC